MNILIPMAGNGQRFKDAGYKEPKPFIDVLGKPMIQRVIDNLGGPSAGRFIFVVRDEEAAERMHKLMPTGIVIVADVLTAGAACTALLAEGLIDSDVPLVIANSDQLVEMPYGYLPFVNHDGVGYDGAIYTFTSDHPKWSYAAVDDHGSVWGVAEKQPISNRATCGIYRWAKGSRFVRFAKEMIAKNHRVNNEFYVAPVFNYAIADGAEVAEVRVHKMWGLGTPEDLHAYEDAHRS